MRPRTRSSPASPGPSPSSPRRATSSAARRSKPSRPAAAPLKLVGLLLEDRGVLRSHQKVVVEGAGDGETTSGTFSPTLERSIAFARVPAKPAGQVQVDIRGKLLNARRREAAVRSTRQAVHQSQQESTVHEQCSGRISSTPSTHEWVRDLQDGTVEIGITDHAQQALGDLVFVEVPETGRQLGVGEALRGGRIGQGGFRRLHARSRVKSPPAIPRLAATPEADQSKIRSAPAGSCACKPTRTARCWRS